MLAYDLRYDVHELGAICTRLIVVHLVELRNYMREL